MKEPLLDIIKAHKSGETLGIYSVCSANPHVLEASFYRAKLDRSPLLIESTSNQVNQYGGYTGKNPSEFYDFVIKMAKQMEFPIENLIIGGDHLGPNPWQTEESETAMSNAAELVKSCVAAGYRKIHLDASMRCADDPGEAGTPFNPEIVAARAAELCGVAEKTVQARSRLDSMPVYVIGTDVPIPGGALEELKELHATPVEEVKNTIQLTRQAFLNKNLESAWERVIAVVVQPGVEFDDTTVFEYDRNKASDLSAFIENQGQLVYEAHSTDYQTAAALTQMVADHFAILKVGPALTFAFREAVFNLALIEKELLATARHTELSNIQNIVEIVMTKEPKYWQKHYHGSYTEKLFARKYSFSDRIRYYWPHPEISEAIRVLLKNLSENPVPLALLSQYMPNQYQAVRNEEIQNKPGQLIRHKIGEVLQIYAKATGVNHSE